ncbi:MAG: hypothetical protein A2675_00680 [Candidatus Yonathbacteria bacterium RIFCSPHIGHO2_01_FULL_51_10]|uniref:Peptidase S74 domain-containing protein n=1 Tax=Candidatus Yonathbacteria bacterium RIFCSPHIGHO2_01_FULL_51_10 TaxID=1802723 RepID=A0A1G2S5G6_9BACT|nr:MAG: hypothetical protein A2675_00680 [Candidatus Yonathbacteria bacterium RIFCSPHIGHO2_01_FULL_51_10]
MTLSQNIITALSGAVTGSYIGQKNTIGSNSGAGSSITYEGTKNILAPLSAASALYGVDNVLASGNGGTVTTMYGTSNTLSSITASPVTTAYGNYNNITSGATSGVITNAYGTYTTFGSTGTITNGYGEYISFPASGNITNAYGVYVGDASSPSVTSSYGLYLADQVWATPTGGEYYALYSAGGKSYFAGNIGIGTTSPYAALSVVGEVVAANFTATSTTATSTFNNISIATGASYRINGVPVMQIVETSGTGNFSIGPYAGVANTSGLHNTFVGSYAGNANTTGPHGTFVGNHAGYSNVGGDNSVFVGDDAGYFNTEGDNNTFLGQGTGYVNTTGSSNTFVGHSAGHGNDTATGNVGIGRDTLYNNTAGIYNSALGYQSLYSNVYGGYNVAIGQQSLYTNNDGSQNIALGQTALYKNVSGNYNIAQGLEALYNTTSDNNIALGAYALRANTTGTSSIAIGFQAGRYTKTGSYNVIIGEGAGYGVTNMSFGSTTMLGYHAGYSNTTGSNNIFLGFQSGESNTTGSNNIIIGYDVDAPSATSANTLNIGNLIFGTGIDGANTTLSSGNVGIGTAAPAKSLQVVGDIRVGTSGTNGCIEDFAGSALTGVCSSDASLKTNIQPIGSVLPGLVQLTPSTFYWNDIAGNELHNSTTTLNYGLVAQDVARVLPGMVATTSNGYLGVNYSMLPILTLQGLKELDLNLEGLASATTTMTDTTGNKTFVGRFFDRITGWLADAANGLTTVFANVFNAKEKICVDGECLTKSDIKALLEIAHGSSQSANAAIDSTTAALTPIVISINGNNPATLNIGDTYGDLGALIISPESAKNFGIKASLDGGPDMDISQISIDTTAAGTHTVVYSVIDQNNLTTTAERVVNVVGVTPAQEVAEDTGTTTTEITTPVIPPVNEENVSIMSATTSATTTIAP